MKTNLNLSSNFWSNKDVNFTFDQQVNTHSTKTFSTCISNQKLNPKEKHKQFINLHISYINLHILLGDLQTNEFERIRRNRMVLEVGVISNVQHLANKTCQYIWRFARHRLEVFQISQRSYCSYGRIIWRSSNERWRINWPAGLSSYHRVILMKLKTRFSLKHNNFDTIGSMVS